MSESIWPPTGDKEFMYRIFSGENTIGHVYRDKVYPDGARQRYQQGYIEPTVMEWLVYEFIWRGDYEKARLVNVGPVNADNGTNIFYSEARRLWAQKHTRSA